MHLKSDDSVVDVRGGRIFVRRRTPDACSTGVLVVPLHGSLGSVAQWRDVRFSGGGRLQPAARKPCP